MADLVGLEDAVDDSLIVENLAGGHGSLAAGDDGVQEGTDLLVPQVALVLDQRNGGLHGRTGHVTIKGHGLVETTVPAFGGRNAQAALGAQNQGVASGVHMHIPGNAEVYDHIAVQTDVSGGKIIHGELLGALGLADGGISLGSLAAEIAGATGDGQRLGVADGVQHHIQRVAADVAHGADAGLVVLNEGLGPADGDAVATTAAGLDVVHAAKFAGLDNLLDHLHIGVQTGLEADGHDLAALLFSLADRHGLVQRDGHGLLQQHVQAMLQGVDGAYGVIAVIHADADGVHGHGVDHLLVVLEGGGFHVVFLQEFVSLAGDQVAGGHDLHVGLMLIGTDVAVSDSAGADDADAQFLIAVNGFFFRHVGAEVVHIKSHVCFLPLVVFKWFLYVRTFERVYAANGSSPMDRIADDLKNFRLIIDREFFMAGLEVENPSVAAEEAAAGAEHFAALIIANEDQLIGFGNVEGLAVGFHVVDLDEATDALSDGMGRVADPYQFTLGILPPGQIAGSTHQAAERFGMMTGMKEDRTHALQHGLLHPIHHFVRHFFMRHVAPPDQHVGLVQHLLAQTVGKIVQRDRANADFVAFQSFFQRTVDPFGIDSTNRVGRFFMKTFVVYRYTNQGLHLLSALNAGAFKCFGVLKCPSFSFMVIIQNEL